MLLINKHVIHFNLALFSFSYFCLLIEVLIYSKMAKGKTTCIGLYKKDYPLLQGVVGRLGPNKTLSLKTWFSYSFPRALAQRLRETGLRSGCLARILALQLSGCVTLGRSFNLAIPRLSQGKPVITVSTLKAMVVCRPTAQGPFLTATPESLPPVSLCPLTLLHFHHHLLLSDIMLLLFFNGLFPQWLLL